MECVSIALAWLAQHAPIVTATVAITAVWVAWRSLQTQRDTARKRAALDLFFKTEMDKSIATAFEQYDDHIKTLLANPAMPMNEFSEKHKLEYLNILSCLNIHELIAVGIYTCVLDEEVCYQFWSDEIRNARRDAIRVIEYVRTDGGGGSSNSYTEMVKLAKQWDDREARGGG
jgi:hypothetical protein